MIRQRYQIFCAGADIQFFFFFNDTATTEIYTLSLHDALPISPFMVQPSSTGLATLVHPEGAARFNDRWGRSEEHTSELQSPCNLVCRLLLEKKKSRDQAAPERERTRCPPLRGCWLAVLHSRRGSGSHKCLSCPHDSPALSNILRRRRHTIFFFF